MKKMRIAVVYTSVTGNTKELAEILQDKFQEKRVQAELFTVKEFPLESLSAYDGLVLGTFTWSNGWSNGCIPRVMRKVYRHLERADTGHLATAVFGTGDRFFPDFCAAVDEFRDMLYVQSDLAVTMKVELRPQSEDIAKCTRFVECMIEKIEGQLPTVLTH